jgi:hypothetical protein
MDIYTVQDEHELMTTIAAENRETAGQNTQIVPYKFVCDARVSSFGVNMPLLGLVTK